MGETWQDRIDMAFLLKELDVDSVPINFLIPIKGTVLGERDVLSPFEALKILDEAQKKAITQKLAITGLQTIRAACLTKLGRLDEAASAIKVELSLPNCPDSKNATKIHELIKNIKKKERTFDNELQRRSSSLNFKWEQVK